MEESGNLNNANFGLSTKNVLITGCAQGLGLEISKSFAKEGSNIFAIDKAENLSNLKKELQKINPRVKIFAKSASILKEKSMWQFKKYLDSKKIVLDIIINNVGITLVNKFESQKLKELEDQFETNIIGMMLVARIFGEHLTKSRKGNIVNISSVDALVPKSDQDTELGVKGVVAYASTKGAVISFTKALAIEWADYNIKINAVCPSLMEVPSTQDIMSIPGNKEKYAKRLPLKKLITAKNVANTVLFLSSELSDGITGQAIIVDNGYSSKDV
jgi:NAD(P)-dependent dehydrogenase (short-subunit alcohol dehydrogenase family)